MPIGGGANQDVLDAVEHRDLRVVEVKVKVKVKVKVGKGAQGNGKSAA